MNQERRKAAPARQNRSRASQRRPSSGVGGKLIIMAAVVAAVVFGVAIFFKVNTVEVQGNSIYSAAEIASASGIQKGDNLFTLNKEAAAGSIKASLPYVETVSVIRFLPDRIVIEVKESDATFAVSSDTNTTWLINSVGKALEQIRDSSVTPVQTPPLRSLRPTRSPPGTRKPGRMRSRLRMRRTCLRRRRRRIRCSRLRRRIHRRSSPRSRGCRRASSA